MSFSFFFFYYLHLLKKIYLLQYCKDILLSFHLEALLFQLLGLQSSLN